jgi:uncharacterized protein
MENLLTERWGARTAQSGSIVVTGGPMLLSPNPSANTDPGWKDSDAGEGTLKTAEHVPSLGHAALFFVLAAPLLAGGQYLALRVAHALRLFGAGATRDYLLLAGSDARLGIPTQAFAYGLVLLCAGLLFRSLWQRPVLEGLHWLPRVALRRGWWLLALGLLCGLANGVLGSMLPMPKDPPILADMMKTPVGAWLMLIFGVTLAPLMEEIAFRGFLLPGFVHAFGALERRAIMSAAFAKGVTVPASVVLTSLPFVLLHGAQVGHAWAPLLLIGLVSVVLCLVRLRTGSVAASTVVHGSYNLSLFLGILWETGGFQHLDKLS